MKTARTTRRTISLLLTLALLLGMLPTTAFAAHEGETPAIIEFKSMTLVNLMGRQWISRYEYAKEENTFSGDVNLNVPSLLRIGFTIEKSQYVNLALYKLDERVVQHPENGDDYAHLTYYYDPEADDLGASVPEEFLGTKIGYINGIQILENIENPDPAAGQVEYHRITDEEWNTIINEAASGQRLAQPMQNIYAYGFKGEKLQPPAPSEAEAAALTGLDDEPVVMMAPAEEPKKDTLFPKVEAVEVIAPSEGADETSEPADVAEDDKEDPEPEASVDTWDNAAKDADGEAQPETPVADADDAGQSAEDGGEEAQEPSVDKNTASPPGCIR